MGEIALAVLIAVPWLTVALAVILGLRHVPTDVLARVVAALTGASFAIAVVAGVWVFATHTVRLHVGGSGVQLDPLAVVLTILVFGLSGLIQSFAVRYLRGDRRQAWFVISAAALTATTVWLVTAASLVVFAIAWVGAGVALVAALATYSDLPQAREGVRRTLWRFAIADAGLLVGVGILIVISGGDQPLNHLGALGASLGEPLGLAVATLLALTALARSSQIPFHGWLPYTLAAPTPVSALMHAGVVNAGAILLVRFAPVISVHGWLMVGIVLVSGATLVWASAARLVRPDVKGRLVYSTMAQMGFMILACGLGAYAAAIFHLVAHSLFKSSLFLGAGQGVRRYLAELDLPAATPANGARRAIAILLAILVPVGGLVLAERLLAPDSAPANFALLAFVAATGIVTLGSALVDRFTIGTVLGGTVGMLTLVFGYVAFRTVFSSAIAPISETAQAPVWLVALPATALLVLELVRRNRSPSSLRDRTYVRALNATTTRPTITKGLAQ